MNFKKEKRKPSGYWTKEMCHIEALKYNTRSEFRKTRAYTVSCKNGWLDEFCSHMIEKQKPSGYWNNFERCKDVALSCNHKTEFRKKYQCAHKFSERNGWLEEITSHMIQLGNKMKRLVYVYVFEDNHAYVGLTDDKDKRFNQHMKRGPISKHIEKTSLIPNYIILSDYIDVGDAQELEHDTKNNYINNGWVILNKGATGRGVGALGTSIKIWTYDICKEEALKYSCRSDFKKNSYAYTSARLNGWLDEICSHMEYKQLPNGYWLHDKERCREEALKYTMRSHFKCSSRSAYKASRKNGWLDEICSHMISPQIPKGYWTKKKCHEEALKYCYIGDFVNAHNGAYDKSCKNGWLVEICSHMIQKKKPNGYWNDYNKCKEEALKYDKRSFFQKNSGNAFRYAINNGWLDEFFPKLIN